MQLILQIPHLLRQKMQSLHLIQQLIQNCVFLYPLWSNFEILACNLLRKGLKATAVFGFKNDKNVSPKPEVPKTTMCTQRA